jgi:hypothetical protein
MNVERLNDEPMYKRSLTPSGPDGYDQSQLLESVSFRAAIRLRER